MNDVLESDPEKLSSTDNEDEEIATEGIASNNIKRSCKMIELYQKIRNYV